MGLVLSQMLQVQGPSLGLSVYACIHKEPKVREVCNDVYQVFLIWPDSVNVSVSTNELH